MTKLSAMLSILYVDDDPHLLALSKLHLEETNGFLVDIVESGGKAIEMLRSKNYDAVIADYQMPAMNGIELLKKVRLYDIHIPFILLTAHGREDVVIEAFNNGVDLYLQKGSDPRTQSSVLAQMVTQVVNKKRAEKALRESQQRMSDMIDFLPDATMAIDTSGKVIAWNKGMEELTKVKAIDIMGKGDYEYAIPFYGQRRPILLDLVMMPSDEIARCYKALHRKDDWLIGEADVSLNQGKKEVLLAKASPLYNEKNEVVGAIESIRDITERKIMERALTARIRYDDGIAACSRSLLADKEGTVPDVLKHLLIASNVSRVFLFKKVIGPNGECVIKQECEVHDPKAANENAQLFDGSHCDSCISRWLQDLRSNKPIVGLIDEMPLEERTILRANGALSILVLPIFVSNDLYGFILFEEDKEWRTWLDLDMQMLRMASGMIEIYIERKQAEEELHRLRRQDQDLMKLARMGQWERDLATGDFIFNDQYYTLHGITAEEAGGYRMTAEDFVKKYVPQVHKTEVKDWGEEALANVSSNDNYEFMNDGQIIRKDGEIRDVNIWFRVEKDENGVPVKFIGVSQDVTDRVRAQERLRKANLVIENSPVVLFGWKAEVGWPISMVSKNVSQFGYSAEDLVSQDFPYESLIHPDDLGRVRNEVFSYYNRGIYNYSLDYRLVKKNGDFCWVTEKTVVIRDQEGKIIEYQGTILDITEKKMAEDALKLVNSKLNLLNSITRHDMTNKLVALHGYIQLASLRNQNPAVNEYLLKMGEIGSIIMNQLVFTKTYQELGAHAPTWNDIGTILSNVSPTSVAVNADCMDLEIYADPMLEMVFGNLFDNSLRHGQKVKNITIKHIESDQGMTMIIEDDGIGVPPKNKELIFEKGFGGNTGFGLFLTREILGITGLQIKETGELGVGARFEITVPKGEYRSKIANETRNRVK